MRSFPPGANNSPRWARPYYFFPSSASRALAASWRRAAKTRRSLLIARSDNLQPGRAAPRTLPAFRRPRSKNHRTMSSPRRVIIHLEGLANLGVDCIRSLLLPRFRVAAHSRGAGFDLSKHVAGGVRGSHPFGHGEPDTRQGCRCHSWRRRSSTKKT